MSFCIGSSKIQYESNGEEIIGMGINHVHKLLCLVFKGGFKVFRMKKEGIQCVSEKEFMERGDELESAVVAWKSFRDQSLLCVQSSSSTMEFYQILGEGEVVKFSTKANCEYGKISCCCWNLEFILLGTSNGYLSVLLWSNGEVVQILGPDFLEQKKMGSSVKQLVYCRKLKVFGVVLQGGFVALVKRIKALGDDYLQFKKIFQAEGVSIASCEYYLAVGLLDGQVNLYHYNSDFNFKLQLNIKNHGGFVRPISIGKPVGLEFNFNGNVIAISYELGGLAVYNTNGHLLMTNVTKVSQTNPKMILNQLWNREGYQLFVNEGTKRVLSYNFFVKTTNLSPTNVITLKSIDQMLILRSDYSHCEFFQVPREYIEESYPIKNIVVSNDGSQFCVAAKYGMCFFNSDSRKWKLFGSQAKEKTLKITAMTWIENDCALLANFDKSSSKGRLILYSRFQLSNPIIQVDIGGFPIFHCSYAKNLILLYDSQKNFHVIESSLKYVTQSPQDVSITARLTVLASIPSNNPQTMVGMHLLQHHSRKNIRDRVSLHLYSDRTLRIFYINFGEEHILEHEVDDFWIERETSEELIYFLFNHDKGLSLIIENLKVFDRPPSKKDETVESLRSYARTTSLIPFDCDLCPFGPIPSSGEFFHGSMVTQDVIVGKTFFELQQKPYPYIHIIVLHRLLNNTGESSAMKLIQQYENQEIFQHILDYMIYSVMQYSKVDIESKLKTVVNFLRKFQSWYPTVIVQCLRKIDVNSQEVLLQCIEPPVDLFYQALKMRSIEVAVNILRIIQQVDSNEKAYKCAMEIIPLALQMFRYEMVLDLSLYMNKIKLVNHMEPDKTEATSLYIQGWLSDNLQIQILVTRHIRMLLKKGNFHHLFQAVKYLQLPFQEWLKHEKYKSALVSPDIEWESHFSAMHKSFHLPRARLKPSKKLLDKQLLQSSSNTDVLQVQTLSHTQSLINSLPVLKTELEMFSTIFRQSNCIMWALLLDTLLGKVDSVIAMLQKEPKFLKPYITLLHHQNNAGYIGLKETIMRECTKSD